MRYANYLRAAIRPAPEEATQRFFLLRWAVRPPGVGAPPAVGVGAAPGVWVGAGVGVGPPGVLVGPGVAVGAGVEVGTAVGVGNPPGVGVGPPGVGVGPPGVLVAPGVGVGPPGVCVAPPGVGVPGGGGGVPPGSQTDVPAVHWLAHTVRPVTEVWPGATEKATEEPENGAIVVEDEVIGAGRTETRKLLTVPAAGRGTAMAKRPRWLAGRLLWSGFT